jgi:hypothetical protein
VPYGLIDASQSDMFTAGLKPVIVPHRSVGKQIVFCQCADFAGWPLHSEKVAVWSNLALYCWLTRGQSDPQSVGYGEIGEVEPFRVAVRVDNLDPVINLPGRGDIPAAALNILEELRQRHVAGQLWGG